MGFVNVYVFGKGDSIFFQYFIAVIYVFNMETGIKNIFISLAGTSVHVDLCNHKGGMLVIDFTVIQWSHTQQHVEQPQEAHVYWIIMLPLGPIHTTAKHAANACVVTKRK